ncbi:MAG: DUF3500 domain-containing protein [Gammaproteobacteria bacterium]|nr:DUF3500 domain-containing protein [Gammaproteobacteria bacterium]
MGHRTKTASLSAAIIVASSVAFTAYAQRDESFVGVTTDGHVVPRVFAIESTGVSTAPYIEATQGLLELLDGAQRDAISFPVDGDQWREWSNTHRAPRRGLSFEDMNKVQAAAAFDMLATALSAKGLKTTRDIMRLNAHLAWLTGRDGEYGEQLYWLAIMGTPSPTEPWGWQLEGHHLIVNCFVLGDQVVMTPTFLGSEPVYADDGPYAGTRVLQAEEQQGLSFVRSLSDEQWRRASLGDKHGNTILAQANSDNVTIPYAGIRATELTAEQRDQFVELIAEYVGNMKEDHAAVRMAEIVEHLDDTWFAWVGATDDDAIFYYRIQSPVVLIEFDHQRPIALRELGYTARDHIHSVTRTPNGNDYGKDLLRQHYERFQDDLTHGHD